ncbi:MAG TPA: hypothetical protein VHH32_06400, partial [Gemmatimonadales bacterium]|nr:hypothetical protein [Gemmatimonadales bacterium]
MAEALTIRNAIPADAHSLAELSRVLGYPSSTAALAQRLEHLLGCAEEAVFVAELPSGRVVGWVHGSEQELLVSD